MNPVRDINNNSFSKLYQNKVFFYFVLILGTLLLVLKLPMAAVFYETICNLITFAPMVVILAMATIAYIKSQRYPDYQSIIRKFYLLFTLKFLLVIFVFYIFYSPTVFSTPILAFFHYLKTLFTLEAVFFALSYLLTGVIALATIFVFFRVYQKSQNKYTGSIPTLTKRTLYAVFAFCFLVFVSSAAAYPQSYKPLTDTLGDAIFTLSAGNIQVFKGTDPVAYTKLKSLKEFTNNLSDSLSQTSQNLAESNEDFQASLDAANSELKDSIKQTSKDLSDKIKDDLSNKVSTDGGTLEGSLTLSGSDSDLTVEGTTTTKDIIPDSTLSYNLGESGKSWNTIYAHRLIGASPIFIGNGASAQGLTNDGDLVVTNDAEIQGILYAENIRVNGVYSLPTTDGAANQLLKTNGSGTLSWVTEIAPGGTTGQLQFNNAGLFGADTDLFWNNSAKRLGIGTSSPTTELEVAGTVKATAFMLPGGIYLTSDTVSTNYWAEDSGNIFRETGNVGLGNNDPSETLDLSGRIHLRQVSAPVTTTDKLYNTAGDLYWSGLKMLTYDSGTSNVTVAGTVSATNFFDVANSIYLTAGSINGNYWGESGGNIYRETGNVGVGTNSPGYALDIAGDVKVLGGIGVGTSNPSVSFGINSSLPYGISGSTVLSRSGGNLRVGSSVTWTSTSLYSDSLERLTVATGGNVGIGTTSPGAKLTVSTSANASRTTGLKLENTYSTAGTDVSIDFRTAGSDTITTRMGNIIESDLSRSMYFSTWTGAALTEKIRILGNGNVGIGTTSPGAKLDVFGTDNKLRLSYDATNNADLSVSSAGSLFIKPTNAFTYFNTASKNNFFYVYDYAQSPAGSSYNTFSGNMYSLVKDAATVVNISNNGNSYFNGGNVGIGTTAPGNTLPNLMVAGGKVVEVQGDNDIGLFLRSTNLVVGQDIWTDYSTGNAYYDSRYNSDTAQINFRTKTNGTPVTAMTILGNGYVGIGTTSPASKLDIGGVTTFRGNVIAGTDNTYDIGASGATRPRTGYFGTSVVVPTVSATTVLTTNATISGALTLSNPIQNYNSFTGWKTSDSVGTNLLAGKSSKIKIAIDGVDSAGSPAQQTNQNYDQAGTLIKGIDGDPDHVINVDLTTNGLYPAGTGVTYATGKAVLSFYWLSPSGVTARVKDKNGVWTAMTMTQNAASPTSWSGTIPIANYLTDMEFTISTGTGAPYINTNLKWSLTQIEYHASRMTLAQSGLLTSVGGFLGGNMTIGAGANFALDTATGTRIGTGTTQKLGFWNATPIVQPANTTAIDTLLVNAGLRAAGGIANFDTAVTGSIASGGNLTLQSTSHATKGKILFGTSAYDEVNNRLGIGTVAPGGKVEVAQETTFSYPTLGTTKGAIHISPVMGTNDNTTALTFGGMSNSVVNSGQAGIYVQSSGVYGTKMHFATTNIFATGSQSRMMIDPTGNVGIGTTTPGVKLDVSGDIRTNTIFWAPDIRTIGITSNGADLTYSAASTLNHIFKNNSVESMRIINGGNVGIGTTTPSLPLHVQSAVTYDGTYFRGGSLRLEDSTAQATGVGGAIDFAGKFTDAGAYSVFGKIKGVKENSTTANGLGSLAFMTSSAGGVLSEKMTILGSGSVGIGDTTPDTTLKVVGSICAKADGNDCFGATAGNIYATNFIVDGTTHLPDYVFEKNYPLLSLADLQTYIDANQHLPGVPSAGEVIENGLNLAQMVPAILEKTEENTLYILQNNEQLNQQGIQTGVQTQLIASLQLKTDQNITTIQQLQTSVDTQLGVVSVSLNAMNTEISNDQLSISNKFSSLNDQMTNFESRIKTQEDLAVILQTQIEELKTQIATPVDVAQIELNKNNIAYLNQLLGIDVTKPGDIALLGALTAKKVVVDGVETGAITITVIDKDAATIGTAVIKAGDTKSIISSKAITNTTKVFVTPQAEKPFLWSMTDKKNGEFSIVLDALQTKDVSFDWWIVDAK
ncbi:MAG: hypothetical protein WC238_04165 [Parcubacteria group bacterium]|jgi:hypothetical protein